MKNKNEMAKLTVPDQLRDLDKWETNRRSFLRAALVAGAASQIAWFTSCSTQLEESNEYLTREQNTILKSLMNILWPNDGNGPSVDELNTFGYFMWVLGCELTPQGEKDFLIEGIDWCDKKALEIYGDHYYNLDDAEKDVLVEQIIQQDAGDAYFYTIINYILESLTLDPVYGGNKNEAGWKWLDHEAGNPRPTEMTRVEAIYQKYLPNA